MQTICSFDKAFIQRLLSWFETKLEKLMRNIQNCLIAGTVLHISIPVQPCSAAKDFSCLDLYRYSGHKLCPDFAIHCCEILLLPGDNDIQMVAQYLP